MDNSIDRKDRGLGRTDLAAISIHRWWKSQEAKISQGKGIRSKVYRNAHRSLGSALSILLHCRIWEWVQQGI